MSLVPLQPLPTITQNRLSLTGPYILVKTSTVSQQVHASKAFKFPIQSENSQPETLRCKRRIDFTSLGYSLPKAQPQAVSRRNERERNRVKMVNMGFETLREHVPNGKKNKKMSKVETLRSAVEYIRQLQKMLEDDQAVSAAMTTVITAQATQTLQEAQLAGSPASSYTSDASYDTLSPDDEELLDFASWF